MKTIENKITLNLNNDAKVAVQGCIAPIAHTASLFERNILSLGQAAKLAELHLWDFIRLLGRADIPIAAYDDEEIEQELKAVECLIEQTK